MPPLSAPERIDFAIDMLERHRPYEGMKTLIDEVHRELVEMFKLGRLTKQDFTEFRARLWGRREAVCEALLPEGQRERQREVL